MSVYLDFNVHGRFGSYTLHKVFSFTVMDNLVFSCIHRIKNINIHCKMFTSNITILKYYV